MKLEKMEIEVIRFEKEDIIVTSTCHGHCKSVCPTDCIDVCTGKCYDVTNS